MKNSQNWNWLSVFVLACLVPLAAMMVGCPKQGPKVPIRSGSKNQGGGTNEQIFLQSINSLNHLENHFGQESVAQILRRLDVWIADQSSDVSWQEDVFFAEQEKSLTALSESLRQFADLLEKIGAVDAENASPPTSEDVQKSVAAAKDILERLSAGHTSLGVRHFLEYQQSVREVESVVLTPVAEVAKTRNLSSEDIRRFFQTQFQQLGGNVSQLADYFRNTADVINRFAETFRGSTLNFRRLDGDYFKQVFWCRNISHWASGNRQEEIERAKELFDWTVRNTMMQTAIRTQNETLLSPPQPVWETLLFGKGNDADWSYLFTELLRQHRIDACVFVANIQNSQGQVVPSPWGVGVLVDGKVHVFLVRYGLPLVAEGEIRLEPDKGLVFGNVVTFDQLLAEPALLIAYLGENYPVEQVQTLLDQTTVMVPVDPITHSHRMVILEKALTGVNKAVLSGNSQEVIARFEQAIPGKTVQRWNYPFEAAFQSCLTRDLQDMKMELFKLTASNEHPNPLWKGRILYLSGQRTGQNAATSELQHACVSDSELAAMMDRQAVAMNEPLVQLQTQIKELETALPEASAADKPLLQAKLDELLQIRNQYTEGVSMNLEGLQLQSLVFGVAVGTANYWIGQIHFEEALSATNANSRKDSLRAAYDYVEKRVLKNFKAQQWRHGAEYHLGRVCEARGDYDEAIRHYSEQSQEPDSVGRLFRARQLKRLAVTE